MGVHDPLAHGHADSRRQALPQRAGGGLDARRMTEFGVTRGFRAQLAEILQLVETQRVNTDQMQDRIEQHGAMARRQHEAVAVRPVGVLGIELDVPGPQHGRHIGHAHGHAGVTGLGGLDRIHGQGADSIGEGLDPGRIKSGLGHVASLLRARCARRGVSGMCLHSPDDDQSRPNLCVRSRAGPSNPAMSPERMDRARLLPSSTPH